MWAAAPPEPPLFTVGYRSQVFVAKRRGGVQRLTGGAASHRGAAWSGGGRRIAVITRHEIEIRALDGSVRHRVRGGSVATTPAAWGPDDRRLAFVAYHHRGKDRVKGSLVVTDIDGGHRRVVTDHADDTPEWSPDGRTIYYRVASGTRPIRAVASRGGRSRAITPPASAGSPAFASPDGRWILFRRGTTDPSAWIARGDGTGGAHKVVNNLSFDALYGWVSGGRAVFGGKTHRHPVLTSPSGVSRALGARFYSSQYAVSPDGRQVAWIGGQAHTELRSADSDGSDYRVLARFQATGNTVDVASLAWSPDSRRVAIEPYKHSGD